MNPSELLAKNVIGTTYDTIQDTIIQGDVDWFQTAAQNASWTGMTVLLWWLVLIVIITGIIETGTFLWLILPSDIILSATVLGLVGLGKWRMVALVTLLSIVFTIVGDHIGYYSGYKVGAWLYDRKDTRYFKKKFLIQAQEALSKSGEKFLYTGRFVSFGWLLPTIYGMMKRDKKQFLKVSILSAILWKLSIILPLVALVVIFPWLRGRVALLLLLAAAVPEAIGWAVLLKPQAVKYIDRLSAAKEQINAIRANFNSIKGNIGDIVTKLKTPTEAQALENALNETSQQKVTPFEDSSLITEPLMEQIREVEELSPEQKITPEQEQTVIQEENVEVQKQLPPPHNLNSSDVPADWSEKKSLFKKVGTGLTSLIKKVKDPLVEKTQHLSEEVQQKTSTLIDTTKQKTQQITQASKEKIQEISSEAKQEILTINNETRETFETQVTNGKEKLSSLHATAKEDIQDLKDSTHQKTQNLTRSLKRPPQEDSRTTSAQ